METQLQDDFTIPGFDDVVVAVRAFLIPSAGGRDGAHRPSRAVGRHAANPAYQRCWLCGPPYSGKAWALNQLADVLGPTTSHITDASSLASGSKAADGLNAFLEQARASADPRILFITDGDQPIQPLPKNGESDNEPHNDTDDGQSTWSPPHGKMVEPSQPGIEAEQFSTGRRMRVSRRQSLPAGLSDVRSQNPVLAIADRIASESLPVLLIVSSDEEPPQPATGSVPPFDSVIRSYLPRKSALSAIWASALADVPTDGSVDVAELVNLSVGYTADDIGRTLNRAVQSARLHQGRSVNEVRIGQIDLLGAMTVTPLTIREWELDRPTPVSSPRSIRAALDDPRSGHGPRPKAQMRDIRYVQRGVRERTENLNKAMYREMDRIRARWTTAQLTELH